MAPATANVPQFTLVEQVNVTPEEIKQKKLERYNARPTFGKFRLIRGSHNEGGKTYKKGDTFESKSNLLLHNTPGVQPKFVKVKRNPEYIEEAEPIAAAKPAKPTHPTTEEDRATLESMSVNQLKAMAEEEEIDLDGATRKDDIIEKILASKT
jgi:hypothetical protein